MQTPLDGNGYTAPFADVAQLVARLLAMQKVVSSSLIIRFTETPANAGVSLHPVRDARMCQRPRGCAEDAETPITL